MRTSTRDLGELHERIRSWLGGRLGCPVTVSALSHPSGNGMSSETLIFDASWEGSEGRREVGCVARMAPAGEAVPVFPDYDLGRQFEIMRLARERAGTPAPRALWFEPDPAPLGTSFFVMERLAGDVPPDVLPYTFEGWLLDASPPTANGSSGRAWPSSPDCTGPRSPPRTCAPSSSTGRASPRSGGTSTTSGPTTSGRTRRCGSRCWSGRSTGWRSTGRPIPAPTC
nr:hypothetical protein GCM10020093_112560 [Planobispora longispora]